MNNEYKCYTFDIDGTLIQKSNHMDIELKRAFDSLTKSNIKVVLATGRPYKDLKQFIMENDLVVDSVYLNGGAILIKNDYIIY